MFNRNRKFVISILISLAVSRLTNAQSLPTLNSPIINIDTSEYNLGTIRYNAPVAHIYSVTNSGTVPLIITQCVKSCGCTSVDWTKTPIKSGDTGFIKIVYNSKKVGIFIRKIEIYSNDPHHAKTTLTIKGTVQNDPAASNSPIAKTSLQRKSDGW